MREAFEKLLLGKESSAAKFVYALDKIFHDNLPSPFKSVSMIPLK